jgi:plastocyanin
LAKALGAALVVGAIALGAIALSARATSSGPREIRMVVRDMRFYIEGQADPNPTLRLHRGETVRLVLRNEDGGMRHDFAVPGWHAGTRRIESGEEASVTFRAPDQAASQSYKCTPHGAIMRGTVLVE